MVHRVCYTESSGRHLIARERISPGEVIAVDEAALQVLTPDTVGTHCSHCMAATLAPLHCPECHGVVFCSEVCRSAALESYHRYECRLGLVDLNRAQRERTDNTQSCSSVLLLVRFFTQKSAQFFRDTRPEFQRIMKGSTVAVDDKDVYHSSDYRRLVGLVSHR